VVGRQFRFGSRLPAHHAMVAQGLRPGCELPVRLFPRSDLEILERCFVHDELKQAAPSRIEGGV